MESSNIQKSLNLNDDFVTNVKNKIRSSFMDLIPNEVLLIFNLILI
jgi:hypothetical protein